ncbi:MAG: hypothetical protein ACOCWQ_04050 [Nanoarchaeota archaeon]
MSAVWSHYGSDQSWGTRTWGMYSANEDVKFGKLTSIIAEDPSFGRLASPWITGRSRGDIFDASVTTNPLDAEAIPLAERTRGGWVGEVTGTYLDVAGDKTSTVSAEVGHRFNITDTLSITPTVHTEYVSMPGQDVVRSGAGVYTKIADVLGGSLNAEVRYQDSMSGPGEPEVTGGFNWVKKW